MLLLPLLLPLLLLLLLLPMIFLLPAWLESYAAATMMKVKETLQVGDTHWCYDSVITVLLLLACAIWLSYLSVFCLELSMIAEGHSEPTVQHCSVI
jgi:hypothetical protein